MEVEPLCGSCCPFPEPAVRFKQQQPPAVLLVLAPSIVTFPRVDGAMLILALFLDCTGTIEFMKTVPDLKISCIKWHFDEKLHI